MEKCDWNLQYFLELAQMWFKKKKKTGERKQICWSIIMRLQKIQPLS